MNPTTEPVDTFQPIQGQPHPGVATEVIPSGSIVRAPKSGPRTHQTEGQCVAPTTNPIAIRATYQAHTAIEPRM